MGNKGYSDLNRTDKKAISGGMESTLERNMPSLDIFWTFSVQNVLKTDFLEGAAFMLM